MLSFHIIDIPVFDLVNVINVMLLYPVSFRAKEQLPLKPLSFTLKQSDENPTNVLYMKFMGEYQAPIEM